MPVAPWISNPSKFPKVTKAINSFGREEVQDTLETLQGWCNATIINAEDYATREKVGKLFNSTTKRILVSIVKQDSVPPFLWRGINIKLTPKRGQKVRYSTKRPWTSWTGNKKIGHDFCEYPDDQLRGIVIQATREEIEKQDIFVWPSIIEDDEIQSLIKIEHVDEKEWGIHIVSPMMVSAWWDCQTKEQGYPSRKNPNVFPYFL